LAENPETSAFRPGRPRVGAAWRVGEMRAWW